MTELNECIAPVLTNGGRARVADRRSGQIFNAFFTTKSQGSGMGLAISRSIVESQGGRLWATSNDGRGATFHFTLLTGPAEAEWVRGASRRHLMHNRRCTH